MPFDEKHGCWVREYRIDYERDNGYGNRTQYKKTVLADSCDAVQSKPPKLKSGSTWSGYKYRITCVGSGEYVEWAYESSGWKLLTDTRKKKDADKA